MRAMQRTELSLFARAFARALAPLAGELAGAAAKLAPIRRGDLAVDPRMLSTALEATGDELAGLLTRVAAERSAVFLFGPAKSGKSTLLAALCGALAHEPSLRPGYPCVQRVRHAAEPACTLERLEGSAERVSDATALRLVLARANEELAETVRAARAAGEVFDPARHLRTAVRRVDRAFVCERLERISVELIECPPFSGPLFRDPSQLLVGEADAARVALFVVRPEQLCDGAHFEGVEELLASFGQLLLVVNLDPRGRDIDPQGELVPGAEREDPLRLVEALTALTTEPALERALRDGRARVLVLDALEAARARVAGNDDRGASSDERIRLDELESALAEVLDEHPALRTFVASALRHGRETLAEVRELVGGAGLAELPRREEEAEAERASRERIERALRRLTDRKRAAWEVEPVFAGLREALTTRCTRAAVRIGAELGPAMEAALEDWFATGESLRDLLQGRFVPRLAAAHGELARAVAAELRALLADPALAATLSPELARDLGDARVELGPLVRTAGEGVVPPSSQAPALRPLDIEVIPVRPRLRERFFFRSEAFVRRALFGPPELPGLPLTSEEKQRRLGREARSRMKKNAEGRAQTALAERARAMASQSWEALLAAFATALERHVERELARLANPLEELTTRVQELRSLREALGALERALERAGAGLVEVAQRFPVAAALLVPRARGGDADDRADANRSSAEYSAFESR